MPTSAIAMSESPTMVRLEGTLPTISISLLLFIVRLLKCLSVVFAFFLHELLVGTTLYYLPLAEVYDLIGLLNGG